MADAPLLPALIWDVLTVNGFLYRFNKTNGELWRLEANTDPADRKTTKWKKIDEVAPHGA